MQGDSVDWSVETLPRNIPVVAMQCRTVNRRSGKQYWNELNTFIHQTVNTLKPRVFLIYGGVELKKKLGKLPSTTEFVYVDGYTTKRRHLMKEKS